MVADKEIRERIVKTGIRKIARLTGIHSDTITLVAKGEALKSNTVAKVVGFIEAQSDDKKKIGMNLGGPLSEAKEVFSTPDHPK